MTRKLLSLSLLASVLASTTAGANTPPPNTLNMTGQSPVIAAAPSNIQQDIVPSLPYAIQNVVQEYINAQPTPDQIEWIKKNGLDIARATASPYVDIPRPVVRSMAVNLAPGEAPPIVRLSKNMVTSIVVTDNDGNPWPVEKVVVNQQQFVNHTSTDENGETNIITLEPTESISWSNMSVTLRDKAIPVIFLLTAGQPEVDLRVDARVPGMSPNAVERLGERVGPVTPHTAISNIDDTMLHFLDGTISSTAERLVSSSPDAQGWLVNDALYVKTRYDILYPSYQGKASSSEGVHVYRFDNGVNDAGNSVITMTQRGGQPVTISFEKQPYLYYNH
ncbi:DotH/IcmK family type IV secretion protein [Moraxella sp. ZJ142]|uniref:DotH/IcmK family type IV secretion protein n=1 Tax=Moraxella marmotae TaxID=3344520 RepID=UPI0035D4DB35